MWLVIWIKIIFNFVYVRPLCKQVYARKHRDASWEYWLGEVRKLITAGDHVEGKDRLKEYVQVDWGREVSSVVCGKKRGRI